jgi:hypothetical protein
MSRKNPHLEPRARARLATRGFYVNGHASQPSSFYLTWYFNYLIKKRVYFAFFLNSPNLPCLSKWFAKSCIIRKQRNHNVVPSPTSTGNFVRTMIYQWLWPFGLPLQILLSSCGSTLLLLYTLLFQGKLKVAGNVCTLT